MQLVNIVCSIQYRVYIYSIEHIVNIIYYIAYSTHYIVYSVYSVHVHIVCMYIYIYNIFNV